MYCEGCKWLDINETNNSVISIRSLRPKIYCKRYETSLTKTLAYFLVNSNFST